MADDAPYELDFLQHVTNVNFGGDYFCVAVGLGLLSTSTVDISFPQMSGGTPGFHVGSLTLPVTSYTVTKSDVAGKLRTLGGLTLDGFKAAFQVGVAVQQTLGPAHQYYIIQMPGSPFLVRLVRNVSPNENIPPVGVGIFPKNVIKAGLVLSLPKSSSNSLFPAQYGSEFGPNTHRSDGTFRLDPMARTVSLI